MVIGTLLSIALLAGGCSDNGSSDKDGSITDSLGNLHVIADYSGSLTPEAKVVVALMECPWNMPPKAFGDFPISSSSMEGEMPNIPPGDYCVTAYIDMIPGDNERWERSVDPAAVTEETDPSINVTIEAGKTTNVTMTFNMKSTGDDGGVDSGSLPDSFVAGDGSTPGADDVWIEATVTCSTCGTVGSFVIFGNKGPTLPVAFPEIYVKVPDPTWPLTVLLKANTPPTQYIPEPFPAEQVTVKGYHDADNLNPMGPDNNEPVSAETTVTLQKGTLNTLIMALTLR
jgi:hypothetical protein